MDFKDFIDDIFESLYGESWNHFDGMLSDYYNYECVELENQLKTFYISVNNIIKLNTEDIMKQIITWEYQIGNELYLRENKLREVSKRILNWLNNWLNKGE